MVKLTTEQMEKIKDFAREKCKNNDMNHDMRHIERTVKLAKILAMKEHANEEICEAAAWLHDILHDKQFKTHDAEGSKVAKDFLISNRIDENFAESVSYAISCHHTSSKSKPKTKEDYVLFDADKLQAIGPFGFGRVFRINLMLGKDYKEARKICEDKENIVIKILYTKTAKSYAKTLHKFMQQFYKLFDKWEAADL